MTDAIKKLLNDWISDNLTSSPDPYGAIHDAGNGDGTIQADGYLNLGELTGLIESAERERCAKIAATYFEWHKPRYPEYCDGDPAEDIAAKIRSTE